jgi:hypothetical protein
MKLEIALFISHGWDTPRDYQELTALLDSIPEFRWHDLSITKDRALTIATGDDAINQKNQLLRERRAKLAESLGKVRAQLERERKKLTTAKKDYFELCDYGTIDRRIWSARQKIGPVSTELIKTWELDRSVFV